MRRRRNLVVKVISTVFEAKGDHIVAVIDLSGLERIPNTIGIRFNSPEKLLEFMSNAMDQAAKVWPDNEWIKSYKE